MSHRLDKSHEIQLQILNKFACSSHYMQYIWWWHAVQNVKKKKKKNSQTTVSKVGNERFLALGFKLLLDSVKCNLGVTFLSDKKKKKGKNIKLFQILLHTSQSWLFVHQPTLHLWYYKPLSISSSFERETHMYYEELRWICERMVSA